MRIYLDSGNFVQELESAREWILNEFLSLCSASNKVKVYVVFIDKPFVTNIYHMILFFLSETPFGNVEQCYEYFKELVLCHAVKVSVLTK